MRASSQRFQQLNVCPLVSAPSTPPKGGASKGKGRARASSLSTSSDPNNIQCSGITKTGNRCTRTVKSRATLSSYDPDESIEPFEVFCFQHIKEVLSPTGFRSRKGDKEWVKFDDYIPNYLSEETKVALRVEMEKPPSEKDVDGYIYCFEILSELLSSGLSVTQPVLAPQMIQPQSTSISKSDVQTTYQSGLQNGQSSVDHTNRPSVGLGRSSLPRRASYLESFRRKQRDQIAIVWSGSSISNSLILSQIPPTCYMGSPSR